MNTFKCYNLAKLQADHVLHQWKHFLRKLKEYWIFIVKNHVNLLHNCPVTPTCQPLLHESTAHLMHVLRKKSIFK